MPVDITRRQPTESLPVQQIRLTDVSGDRITFFEAPSGERLIGPTGVLIEPVDALALANALREWAMQ